MQQTADGAADLLVLFLHSVNHPLRTSGFTQLQTSWLSGRQAYRQIDIVDQGM